MEDPEFVPTVTAAVTIPPPAPLPPLTAAPPDAMTNPTLPVSWTLSAVAAFVRDLAMEIYDEPTILQKHWLTKAQYDVIKGNEYFKNALENAISEWHSPQHTQRRLAMQAAIAVEDGLPVVAARLSNPREPLGDVVSLLKVLSDIAGVVGARAAAQQQPGHGQQFKITINLGADSMVRTATPVVMVDHDQQPAAELEIQQLPQGRTP